MELYSPEGLRIDGRRWNELRRFQCAINTHPQSSDGSSYVEQGNTKVVCTVQGPMEPLLRSQQRSSAATIEVSLNVASFSKTERRKRLRTEKNIVELKATLERTFEECVMCHLYPRTVIEINIQVLAQDGSLLATAANAATLALIDAGIAMYDYVASISAGLHNSSPLVDLNSLEESDTPTLTIGVVGQSEKLALLLLEDKMPLDRLEQVLAIAVAGTHRVRELMDDEMRKHGERRLKRMSNV